MYLSIIHRILVLGLVLTAMGPRSNEAQGAPSEVTFGLSSHTNAPGETVTARVTVSGFAQVTSAQFTLQWDPAVLAFVGTGGYGLNGLAAGNFGMTLTNSGKLTFSWDDPNAVGVTVADGTVIFTVSFAVAGSGGSVSPLAFVDVPTLREVAVNFEVAAFGSVAGQVRVISPASPPVITDPPDSRTNVVGSSASFSVTATGTPPLSYQWLFNGTNALSVGTDSVLTLTNIQPAQAGDYQVVVTNVAGGVTSEVAVLTVVPPGQVTFTLSGHTNQPGETVTAQVTVSGFAQVTSAQFTLQWDPAVLAFVGTGGYGLNGLAAGNFGTTLTNSGKLTFSWDDPNAVGVTVADGTVIFTVSFVVAGSGGSVSPLAFVDVPTLREVAVNFEVAAFGSVAGQVRVISPASPPVASFTGSPTNGAAPLTVTFTNLSSGATNYSWNFGDGKTSTVTKAANTYTNAGSYTVKLAAIGAGGTNVLTRTNYIVVTNVPPTITAQPQSQTVTQWTSVTFTVAASGTTPFGYQWRLNNIGISGATASSYTRANVQLTDAGNYSAVVSNVAGSATSSNATLTVIVPGGCVPPPAGLVGWWPGDGNANDIAGTNNGILQGGAIATAVGLDGSAFSFDGTNSYVQVPDAPVLHPTNLTIETWVRFSSLNSAGSGGSPAGDQYMVFKQNTRSTDFEGFDLSKTRVAGGDVFRFLIASATAQVVEIHSATLVTTGVWYHVAAVRGSNFTQIYVNGQLERQTNVAFAQNYGSFPLLFGSSGQSSWDHKLKGLLDEVSLYSRALSSNEVAAIYYAGAAGKCKVQPPSLVVTPPRLDFGLISTGALAQASFVASNAGTATLQGSAIVDAPFTILSGTPFTLDQSVSANLVIRFVPLTPGVFSNAVVITSNGGTSTNQVTGRAVGAVTLLSQGAVGADFIFSFDTIAGLNYVVQYKDEINGSIWQVLQAVSGDGTSKAITNSLSTVSQRFYRLSVE